MIQVTTTLRRDGKVSSEHLTRQEEAMCSVFICGAVENVSAGSYEKFLYCSRTKPRIFGQDQIIFLHPTTHTSLRSPVAHVLFRTCEHKGVPYTPSCKVAIDFGPK